MIYDCFLFNNEFELLEIRLHTLATIVERFVIIEGASTFTGQRKDFNHVRMSELIKEFPGKIFFQIVPVCGAGPREREAFQRNKIAEFLTDCADDDIIMLSDADEIPDSIAIKKYAYPVSFEQSMYFYYLNCRHSQKWIGSVIGMYGHLKERSPQFWRDNRGDIINIPGGWHFSYQGGIDRIIKKLENTSEQQDNTERNKDRARLKMLMETGQDIFERDEPFTFIPPDSAELPQYVRENSQKFIEKGFLKI
jgi:beta-1,4-mannosyl-glycoprotein beta-1,4-N-acetylglucosaminyltransferase